MSIFLERVVVGQLSTNCYVVYSDRGKSCLIFDPGDEARKIINSIHALGLEPLAVILTHGHWDHFGAAAEISRNFGIKTYVHKDDVEFVKDPYKCTFKNFEWLKDFAFEPDESIEEGLFSLGEFNFEVIHTPGHSKGSCCFYFKDDGFVITGDTLFKNAIGRTDLDCSQPEKMEESLKKLMMLPEETKVYPGHGEATTIEYELEFNPFLNV